MEQRTDTYREVERLLKPTPDFPTWVTSQRGLGKSWRAIATTIRDQTGIDLSDETLRVWFVVRSQHVTAVAS